MKYKILLCLFMLGTMAGCGKSIDPDPATLFKGQSAQQIFVSGEQALAKANYSQAIKNFEGLDAVYPFGQYNRQAQFDIIYAYYKNGDSASCVASADRFIHLFPRDPHVDYAYYLKGMANFNAYKSFADRIFRPKLSTRDLTSAKDAFRDFGTLITLFPQSPWTQDARAHMIYLRNEFANQSLDVARFYMQRRAYEAAINRANEVLLHYSQSPAVIEALEILVKANRMLQLHSAADDALRVLKLNFPQSKAAKELQ